MIPILMYHNIDRPPKGARLTSLYTAPTAFARQMTALKALGYQGLSVQQLLPYLKGERQGKVFGITFDDGYCDNFDHALPVLTLLQFSATCYLVSSKVGQTNSWTKGLHVRQRTLMSAAQAREWQAAGMEIGSHSVSHAHLCHLTLDQAKAEIAESKAALEQMLGTPVTNFCYPYGEYNQAVMACARAAGYDTALTTERKRCHVEDNLFALPRVHVNRRTTLPLFLLKVFSRYEDRKYKRLEA